MTLTAILPSLRRSLPDPMRAAAWPEHAHATTTDVVIAGVSLLRLVELCQTPCAHSGDAFNLAAARNPALRRDAAVVVVRVSAVLENLDAERVVLIDACLDAVPAAWDEARLIGRASTVKATPAIVFSGEAHHDPCDGRHEVTLPADLREGDLLAIPCAGTVSLRDIRPKSSCRELPSQPGDTLLPSDTPLPDVPGWVGRLE